MSVIPVQELPSITDPELVVEQIIDPATDGMRYPYFHRLRELAPVHRTDHPALRGFYLVSSYELAHTVLMKAGNHSAVMDYMHVGSKGDYYQMAKNWMFHRDSLEEHDRIRVHFGPHFTPRALNRCRPVVEKLINQLLDQHTARREMELMHDFAFPLPVMVIARVLGLDDEDVLGLQQAMDRYVTTSDQGHELTADSEAFRDQLTRHLQALFRPYLEERRRHPREDLISLLAQEQARSNKISDTELIDNFVFALIAGHTTTTDMIGNMVIALHRHPEEARKLRDAPERIPAAIAELMRYDSSIAIGERYSYDSIELGGELFARGSRFTVMLHAANHDPAQFADPDTLNLDRTFARQPVSFGAGRYACLGSGLARIELELALTALLTRFPQLHVSELEWAGTLLTHGPKKLRVSW